MSDILEAVSVEIPCVECGEADRIPASLVRESQDLLRCGCPGDSPYECPAAWYASLVERSALDQLETAWSHLLQSARSSGADGARVQANDSSAPLAPVRREQRIEQTAIDRWVDEGGVTAA